MKRLVLLTAAAGLVLALGSPSPAFVSPGPAGQALVGNLHSRCRNYARAAVDYNRLNRRYGCRLRGSMWSSSLDYHYRWCVRNRVPAARLDRYNRLRAVAIRRCRTSDLLRRRCRQYAQVSVRQNEVNQRQRCGYRGRRWSSDYGYHFTWCRRQGAPLAQLDRIVQGRRAQLARCARPRPRPPARTGFTFPRWGGDFLDWCLSGSQGCGQATADAFCRRQGYTRASSFKGPWVTPSRTNQMGTGAACKTTTCQGFYYINCVR
jgi:hypothetical protein